MSSIKPKCMCFMPPHEYGVNGCKKAEQDTDPMWSNLYEVARARVELPDSFGVELKSDQAVVGGRWYYQIKCWRADTYTGKFAWGYGGKAYLSPHMIEGELVQVIWGLYQSYVLHEARESFLYKGRRIFGPHGDLDKLWEAAEYTANRTASNG